MGPKLRHLAKLSGLSKNEALGTLAVLWLWGIKNAEPSGLIKSADKHDVADAISSGLSESIEAIHVVNCMAEAGWIDEREGNLYLHDWDEWQEMWYGYLSRKERDASRKREAYKMERGRSVDANLPQALSTMDLSEMLDEAKKSVKSKKAEPEKKEYADFVHMQEAEYAKLEGEFGLAAANKMVEVLDNYKGSNNKKYADDYRAIRNWVVEKIKRENPGLIKADKNSRSVQIEEARRQHIIKEFGGK